MVYSGDPLLAENLLFKPEHSLIEQSLHSRMGATTTNGDGFGIGWYGLGPRPAVFKSVDPAWNDQNLRELTSQVTTRLLFAHVRASTGTPVQRSNCHPFRHGDWLWMHNGLELCLRARARRLGLRLDGRQEARLRVVHRRQGEGGGAVGRAQGAQGREEGREARRRRTRLSPCAAGSPTLAHRS